MLLEPGLTDSALRPRSWAERDCRAAGVGPFSWSAWMCSVPLKRSGRTWYGTRGGLGYRYAVDIQLADATARSVRN